MSTKQVNKEKGFTIIEVVLVLAIAGLIFLIVFLALPQLQRSRRDTQRKSDAGRALSALETYASNNNGNYPPATSTGWSTFVSNYLTNSGGVFGDPSTGTYTFTSSTPSAVGQIQYALGSYCDPANQGALLSGNARDAAIVVYLENGGATCQDNK